MHKIWSPQNFGGMNLIGWWLCNYISVHKGTCLCNDRGEECSLASMHFTSQTTTHERNFITLLKKSSIKLSVSYALILCILLQESNHDAWSVLMMYSNSGILSFIFNSVDLAVHRWSKLLSMLESLSVRSSSLSVADTQILGVLKDEHLMPLSTLKVT